VSDRRVEFAVLFVETGAEQAARATRRVIAGLDEVDAAGIRRLAPAAAIAELAPHEAPETLLERARDALESVRSARGNRLAVAPPAPVGRASPAGRLGVERS
jgi:GGDEF domain-containing protein